MHHAAPPKLLHTPYLSSKPAEGKAVVSIPAEQLASRIYELPARNQPLFATDPEAQQAARSLGREVPLAPIGQVPEATGVRYRLWKPNEFLESSLSETGSALDLGCGSGRDSVFLAAAGWQVQAVDHLPDALTMARQLEQRYSPEASPIEWTLADLRTFDPARKFDLIAIFFLIDRPLFRRCAQWLKPGGKLIMENFTWINREDHGKPANAIERGELETLLSDLQILHHEEAWQPKGHTVRCIAQAPAERHPLAEGQSL